MNILKRRPLRKLCDRMRVSLGAFLLVLLAGCVYRLLDPTYYYEYDASCPSLNDAERRTAILNMSKALAKDFDGTVVTMANDRDIFSVHVRLPVVAGAPPYWKDTSGAIMLSTFANDSRGSTIGVVISKVPKAEDDLAKTIKSQVETDLVASSCRIWKTDDRKRVYD